MTDGLSLTPLETLFEAPFEQGVPVPMAEALMRLYGKLEYTPPSTGPAVIGNFVTTLDGVTALNTPGKTGGGPISGSNKHDRAVMGILRAISDAVVVGAGTLRSVPRHVWTPGHIFPPLASEYDRLRKAMGKSGPPLNVIVSATGSLDLGLPVFASGEAPVLIVTTSTGADKLSDVALLSHIRVVAVPGEQATAAAILSAVQDQIAPELALVEGGPQLMGAFFGESRLDELFLTLSPQVAGRDGSIDRPGLVSGRLLAPNAPVWGNLLSVKRAEDHLFLRYSFKTGRQP
ncbi:MAG: hypothetical protein FJ319_04015 [SAR202 cluster bacterium]|nr:hypothetical protein [SAR202 cluster bacterium]